MTNTDVGAHCFMPYPAAQLSMQEKSSNRQGYRVIKEVYLFNYI